MVGDMEVLVLLAQEIRDDNQRIYDEHRRSSAFVMDVNISLLNVLQEELEKPAQTRSLYHPTICAPPS